MTWLKQISAWTSRPRLLKHRPFSSWTTHSSPVWYSDGSAHHTVNCKPCVSIKKHPLIRKFSSLGSFLSCSSAFSKVDRIPSVSSGFLPTIVKPFHTYIISCGNRWLLLTNAKIKKKKHISSLRERVLTKAGTTSFTGVEEEYLWAFFAANFSVGIDFPANLSLRPSTCLQTTFQWLYLLIQTK